jgi:hypothetical protein
MLPPSQVPGSLSPGNPLWPGASGAIRAAVDAVLLVAAGMLALVTGLLAHRRLTRRLVVQAA